MDRILEFLNVNELMTSAVAFLPRLFVAIVIMFGFWLIFRTTRPSLVAIFRRAGFEDVLIALMVDKVYRIAMLLFGLVMAASQVGINVGAALAGLGVAGIAIGFAAQDTLANVIAGFVVFMDKPFGVGDYINVEGQFGTVQNITLRSTRVRTNQNTYVVMPNKLIIDAVLVNHSKHGETRVDVPVGIAYKEYIPEARRVLLDAMVAIDGLAASRAPTVVVQALGSSSVDLIVRVWITDAREEMPIYNAVLEAAKLALDKADIQIPYPHLQLFVEDVEERFLKKVATVPRLVSGDESGR